MIPLKGQGEASVRFDGDRHAERSSQSIHLHHSRDTVLPGQSSTSLIVKPLIASHK